MDGCGFPYFLNFLKINKKARTTSAAMGCFGMDAQAAREKRKRKFWLRVSTTDSTPDLSTSPPPATKPNDLVAPPATQKQVSTRHHINRGREYNRLSKLTSSDSDAHLGGTTLSLTSESDARTRDGEIVGHEALEKRLSTHLPLPCSPSSSDSSKVSRKQTSRPRRPEIRLQEDFRQLSGIRPHPSNPSLRLIFLNKGAGEEIGFEMRSGDGFHRRSGIFVHKLGLGSEVDEKGMLRVGDEIVELNSLTPKKASLAKIKSVAMKAEQLVMTVRPVDAALMESSSRVGATRTKSTTTATSKPYPAGTTSSSTTSSSIVKVSGVLRIRIQELNLPISSFEHHGVLYSVSVDGGTCIQSTVSRSGQWKDSFDIDLFNAKQLEVRCNKLITSREIETVACVQINLASLCQRKPDGFGEAGVSRQLIMKSPEGVCLSVRLQMQTSSRYPVRSLDSKNESRSSFGNSLAAVPSLKSGGTGGIPMVVVACVSEIEKRGLDEQGLYRMSGSVEECRRLRASADDNDTIMFLDQLRRCDVHAVCGLLKRFLEQLPEPIFTKELCKKFADTDFQRKLNGSEGAVMFLHEVLRLPAKNLVTIKYFFKHLQLVVQEGETNLSTPESVAIFFAHVLFGLSCSSTGSKSANELDAQVLATRILLCYQLTGDWALEKMLLDGSDVSV